MVAGLARAGAPWGRELVVVGARVEKRRLSGPRAPGKEAVLRSLSISWSDCE